MSDTPKSSGASKTRARSKAASEPKPDHQPAADPPPEREQKTAGAGGGRVAETARRVGRSLRASGQTLAEGNAEIGLKMIDQAEQNVQKAFAAMRAAAKAKDLPEVMKIQADFVREQGERSMAQARQIGEMIVQVGRDSVTTLRPGGAK
jgi:phasin family protein